jgi:hypothetical protein
LATASVNLFLMSIAVLENMPPDAEQLFRTNSRSGWGLSPGHLRCT